jgi:hypothetical protein
MTQVQTHEDWKRVFRQPATIGEAIKRRSATQDLPEIVYTPTPEEQEKLNKAKEALTAVSKTFDTWMLIGAGMEVAKSAAEAITKVTTGSKYNAVRLKYLEQHFGGEGAVLGKTARSLLISCYEKRDEVKAWMEQHPEMKIQNAVTIFKKYTAAQKEPKKAPGIDEIVQRIADRCQEPQEFAQAIFKKHSEDAEAIAQGVEAKAQGSVEVVKNYLTAVVSELREVVRKEAVAKRAFANRLRAEADKLDEVEEPASLVEELREESNARHAGRSAEEVSEMSLEARKSLEAGDEPTSRKRGRK